MSGDRRFNVREMLALYRCEEVSAARALDLRLESLDQDDLPDLPRLPADAAWSLVS